MVLERIVNVTYLTRRTDMSRLYRGCDGVHDGGN